MSIRSRIRWIYRSLQLAHERTRLHRGKSDIDRFDDQHIVGRLPAREIPHLFSAESKACITYRIVAHHPNT